MNPFQVAVSMMQSWMTVAEVATTASIQVSAQAGRQAADAWSMVMRGQSPMSGWQGGWGVPGAMMPIAGGWPLPMMPGWGMPVPAPMPWGMGAWPPVPGNPFAAWGTPTQAMCWAMPFASPFWPMPHAAPARNPAMEFVEQAVTAYRSASGYAVANVMAPFETFKRLH